jgi:hypothetical protein
LTLHFALCTLHLLCLALFACVVALPFWLSSFAEGRRTCFCPCLLPLPIFRASDDRHSDPRRALAAAVEETPAFCILLLPLLFACWLPLLCFCRLPLLLGKARLQPRV